MYSINNILPIQRSPDLKINQEKTTKSRYCTASAMLAISGTAFSYMQNLNPELQDYNPVFAVASKTAFITSIISLFKGALSAYKIYNYRSNLNN